MTGFGRILADLNGASVRYVLVGGIALIRHGVVRATRDVDAVFDPDPGNVERLSNLSTPHGYLDLLSEKSTGTAFEDLLARADLRKVDGIEVPICSLADLVALKRTAGRERDLVDLADLREAHGELPNSPEPGA